MFSPRTYGLLLVAMLVACFGAAARLEPQFLAWRGSRSGGDIFNVALGDSRRMFANSFYVKADEYYHSGYYPTIFDDNTAFQTAHMAEDTGAVNTKNKGDEHGFLGPTRNWIDAFGRNFFPDRHTHLDQGGADDNLGGGKNVREILPWLKLSADLDPDNVETYTVTAFWLRQRMNNVAEADAVLHEGLRNCPGSYEILFELGRLYYESYHDRNRARNVWEEGARQWLLLDPETPRGKRPIRELVMSWISRPTDLVEVQKENQLVMEQLTTHLGKLEEAAGNLPQAIEWFQAAQKVSSTPQIIQKDINDLKYKLGQELNPVLKPLY
jgi:tetratricopeptide (TPR) repeat protein